MKLHKIFNIFLPFILCGFLSGCMEMKTLVTVNKDGSGIIEQSIIPKSAMAQFAALASLNKSMTDQGTETPEEKAKREAEKKAEELKANQEKAKLYGEDVQFVSSESSSEGFHTKEIFSFKDINKIKVGTPSMTDKEIKNPITFSFSSNKGLSKLVINKPPDEQSEKLKEKPEDSTQEKQENKQENKEEQKIGEAQPKSDSEKGMEEVESKNKEITPEQMQILKSFFEGMKVYMSVKIDGKIKSTNATYVNEDNSEIIIMDADFGKLVGNPDFLPYADQLSKNSNMSKGAMKIDPEITKKFPEMKVEKEEKVTVEF